MIPTRFLPQHYAEVTRMVLSPEDSEEIQALTGIPHDGTAIGLSCFHSTDTWILRAQAGGPVLAVGGYDGDGGSLWLICDHRAHRYPKLLLKSARWILKFLRHKPGLFNWVSSRNLRARNFLRHLGATFTHRTTEVNGVLLEEFRFANHEGGP